MARPIQHPCERCGEEVYTTNRHGDFLDQHASERECFQAVRQAACDEMKRLLEVTRLLEQS